MLRARGFKRRVQAGKAHFLALSGKPASAIAKNLRVSREEVFKLVASPLNKPSRLPKTWKAPSSPDEAREWLLAVANHLVKLPHASSSFRFIGRRIKRYLCHPETRDLYKELGLVNPVGRPSSFQTRMREREQGRKIVTLKNAGKPWHLIGDEVGLRDKRSLKRLYDKYSALLPKEQQLERLDRCMKKFLQEFAEKPRRPPKSS